MVLYWSSIGACGLLIVKAFVDAWRRDRKKAGR